VSDVGLSDKGRGAAHAMIRDAYRTGGIRGARECAQQVVGASGYLAVMVEAIRSMPQAERSATYRKESRDP
jgi:hypothetical protein